MKELQRVITFYQNSSIVPFGYTTENNGVIGIDEDKAMLVREIYRLYLLHRSYYKVSYAINNSNNFPCHPFQFTLSHIQSILHNYFYTGNLLMEATDDEMVILPFHHQSIVPSDIWDKVQSLPKK